MPWQRESPSKLWSLVQIPPLVQAPTGAAELVWRLVREERQFVVSRFDAQHALDDARIRFV